MPVIGYLSALSEGQAGPQLAAFRRGLNEFGFVEGQNVAIEFRWADGQYDRLPGMAADLVRRPVSLIVAQTPPAALAAKAATTTIPIVFVVGFDPVGGGLVASLARPGGNVTGLSLQQTDVAGKRLGLLRDLAPKSSVIAMLVNPISPNAAPEIADVRAAAQAMGLQVKMFNASTPNELNAAFAAIDGQRPDALFVGGDPFFVNRREELVALAARLGVPAAYPAAGVCRRRRLVQLRDEHRECLPAGWHLRRPHSQGREAGRPAGHAADQIRVGDQSQDRQDARPRRAANALARADEVIE